MGDEDETGVCGELMIMRQQGNRIPSRAIFARARKDLAVGLLVLPKATSNFHPKSSRMFISLLH